MGPLLLSFIVNLNGMRAFVYKDGFENLVGEDREEAVILEMEVNFEEYPLDSVTNYDQYTDLKPRKNQ